MSRSPDIAQRGALALGALALSAGLLAGCGSSGPAAATSSAATATCQQVGAVLSDGPDPDVDPVGYAEAQIRPLREIHTSNSDLGAAIAHLATAYQQYSSTNGAKAAKGMVSRAAKTINALCPGAGAGI
jgi:hypothetical protein